MRVLVETKYGFLITFFSILFLSICSARGQEKPKPIPGKTEPAGIQDIDELIERLRHADPDVREAAVQAVGDIGPHARKAVLSLIEALQDESAIVREKVATALGKISPDAPEINLMVRTINLARHLPYRQMRLRGIAQQFYKDWPHQIGLIGVTDPGREIDNCLSLPSGTKTYSTQCFASELARLFTIESPPFNGVKSDQATEGENDSKGADVGVVVGAEWTVIGRDTWQLGYNCYCPAVRRANWARKMIEVVLEHKVTKDILRFYTLYFYAGDDARIRTLQAKKATNIIHDRAQPGELPPIVVGDFNARRYFDYKIVVKEKGCLCIDNGDELFFPGEEFVNRPPRECVEFCQSRGYERGVIAERDVTHNVQSFAEKSVRIMEEYFWRPIDIWHQRYPDQITETGIDIIYIGKRESFPQSKNVTIIPVERHDIPMKENCSVEGYPDFSYWLTDHDIAAGFRLRIVSNVWPGQAGSIVVPALVRALKDPDERVRKKAFEALGEIGSPAQDAVPALIDALSDPNANMRQAAALTLGKIGPDAQDAIPSLTEALQDETVVVREVVPDVLDKIKGGMGSVTLSYQIQDASGLVTVAVFQRRDVCQQYHTDFQIPVAPDMIAIGGGAMAARIPEGAFLTSSYPSNDMSAWVVSSKDHIQFNPHQLTGYAIGLKIKGMSRSELLNLVHIATAESGVAQHPEASATVPVGFVLVSGGFKVDWTDTEKLATASFPETAFSWKARSKNHIRASLANLRVYAIGLKEQLPVGRVIAAIQMQESGQESDPASVVNVAPGFALTGGGAEVHWRGVGNLLWKLKPTLTATNQEFSAASKGHIKSDPNTITTYALGIQILSP